jgi:hypothetical protein
MREWNDVVGALAQRLNSAYTAGYPMVEIAAEAAGGLFVFQVSISGRDPPKSHIAPVIAS